VVDSLDAHVELDAVVDGLDDVGPARPVRA
jgi:hypothetical protein